LSVERGVFSGRADLLLDAQAADAEAPPARSWRYSILRAVLRCPDAPEVVGERLGHVAQLVERAAAAHRAETRQPRAAPEVIRAFPSWKRSILTEIYLCDACSYHEIEDGNTRAGAGGHARALSRPAPPAATVGGREPQHESSCRRGGGDGGDTTRSSSE
jgi:hypothetical protein